LLGAHLFCFYFGILADDTPPVGLASYAAAAIAESKPIPTGIQGFLYDMRTAIIPFMFVLNPDILLYQIQSPFQILIILIMTIGGACLFTSVVQGYLLLKNTWYEGILLSISVILYFHPRAPFSILPQVSYSLYWNYGFACLIFLIVLCIQRQRKRLEKKEELK
jgi:TRAP-type uncharacterized transport system fused permease subunit